MLISVSTCGQKNCGGGWDFGEFHWFLYIVRGVNPGDWEVATPHFGQGVVGEGSWTGREILLYPIMYRKYVRKWWLLKRNRIICPEVAVNGQFVHGKSKSFVKLLVKIESFRKFAWRIEFF